jgi:flagellar FliL protein
MKLVRRCVFIMAAVVTSLFSCSILAAGGGDTFKEGVNYIPIKPHLVVNYGGTGKVKYIRAELSLRTEDMHSAQEVSHHMPLIRDTLIMLISSVTDEQMASIAGKEQMRLEALEKINAALARVNDPNAVYEPVKALIKDAQNDSSASQASITDSEAKPKQVDAKNSSHSATGPVSDLLFDNLVVQK